MRIRINPYILFSLSAAVFTFLYFSEKQAERLSASHEEFTTKEATYQLNVAICVKNDSSEEQCENTDHKFISLEKCEQFRVSQIEASQSSGIPSIPYDSPTPKEETLFQRIGDCLGPNK
jgi:hypothetical protein